MIAFFRNEQAVQYLFLFLLAIGLKLHVFFSSENLPLVLYEGFFFNTLISSLSFLFKHPVGFVFTTSLILTHQAYLVNKLNNKADFWSKGSSFPGLFYVVFCSALIMLSASVQPLIIANYFIIICLGYFYDLFDAYSPKKTFYLGFWVGIATIFYFPLSSLFLTAMLFFFFYSNPPLKAYFIFLSGFFSLLFLTFSGFYVTGYTPVFFENIFLYYIRAIWSTETITTEHLFITVYIVILFMGGLVSVYRSANRMSVKVRSIWGFLLLLLLSGLFTFFLFTEGKIYYLYFIPVIFCFFVSRLFYLFKKNLTGEIFLFFLLLMIINFQYKLFIF